MGFRINIPLPKAPPGSVSEGMATGNALTKQMIDTTLEPYTKSADVASKMAYARLMGPQFLSKLFGNTDILANIPPDQRLQALDLLIQAGMGGASGSGNPFATSQSESTGVGGLKDVVMNKLRNLFGGEQSSPQSSQQPQLGGMKNALLNEQRAPIPFTGEPDQEGMETPTNALMDVPQERVPVSMPSQDKSFEEKAGEYKGIVEEGKELGKIRAKSIEELDNAYESALGIEKPINNLIDTAQNPVFQNMRSEIPFFQNKQLHVLSKIGTPEQQRLIGNFISSAKNVVAETARSFGGRLLAKEFDLADQMKVSDNDTWNTMIGKLQAIVPLNEMTKERVRIASELMQKKHISKGKALEKADKMVDGEKIRKEVESRLLPPIPIKNKKTGEIIYVSPSEAKQKYGVK